MRLIKCKNGTIVKIYSSAKEISAQRYSDLQKYLLLDSSTGSTADSIKLRLDRIKAFIEESQLPNALLEIEMAQISLNNAINNVSYYNMAFAVLVAEIGGKTVLDTTEDGLQNTLRQLIELEVTIGDIEEVVDEVKKK